MANILITGAARGIGLELCRQLSARGEQVIAACRTGNAELESLGVEIIAGVEVTADKSVNALAESLAGRALDVLVNCAGILTREGLDDLDIARIRAQFEVNSLGPLRVTRALLPNLSEASKVIIITSRMGSIADNTSGGYYGYRMSKAAVNAVGMSLARDLHDRGIAVALLHPGMVATDMTGHRGIPPQESASNLIARIDALTLSDSGEFRHANGEPLPW